MPGVLLTTPNMPLLLRRVIGWIRVKLQLYKNVKGDMQRVTHLEQQKS